MLPLVTAWRRGKGTQAEIAAAHRMPTATFSWWCSRLSRRVAHPNRLVAVDVEPEPAVARDIGFEVVLVRGQSIRVAPNFDAEALARLIKVLDRPC